MSLALLLLSLIYAQAHATNNCQCRYDFISCLKITDITQGFRQCLCLLKFSDITEFVGITTFFCPLNPWSQVKYSLKITIFLFYIQSEEI